MNLVIDIGNTRTKAGIFENDKIIYFDYLEETVLKKSLHLLLSQFSAVDRAIISSVKGTASELDFLREKLDLYEFTNTLDIPIQNNYHTPDTLGKDRLASATGAYTLYPRQNSLIIDAGTCITIDLLDEKNIYQGGAILLGIQKKAEALHTFTGKLPLIDLNLEKKINILGKTTFESISSGILYGILYEVSGFIEHYKRCYKNLNIIISGGDADYFDKNLNFKKFVHPDLVLIGLNKILNFNAKK